MEKKNSIQANVWSREKREKVKMCDTRKLKIPQKWIGPTLILARSFGDSVSEGIDFDSVQTLVDSLVHLDSNDYTYCTTRGSWIPAASGETLKAIDRARLHVALDCSMLENVLILKTKSNDHLKKKKEFIHILSSRQKISIVYFILYTTFSMYHVPMYKIVKN